ncbi:MAG: hypothetical protein K2G48_01325, partial [Malacoplasma sp.]|nr:hypothetical protein [Malacoplasma sp.]
KQMHQLFKRIKNTLFYVFLINLPNKALKEIWKSYVFDKMIGNNLNPKTIEGYVENNLDFLTNLEKYLKNTVKTYSNDFIELTNLFYKNYSKNSVAIVQSSYKKINEINSKTESVNNKDAAKVIIESVSKTLDTFEWFINFFDSKHFGKALDELMKVNFDYSSITDIVDNLLEKSDILGKFTKIIGAANLALSALSFLLDLFLPETKNYSYQFKTNDGTTFTWNGGQKTTTFMGMITINEKTIEEMKFIDPILIQDANNEEYIYSNGKKYIDRSDLVKDAVEVFIENESYTFMNENVKKVYSLANLENISKESEYSANSIDELTINIINSLKTSIRNNTLSDNYYYNSYTYKYANGYSSDLDAIIRNNVDTILNDIQPVKIVMLPNIDEQTKVPVFDELSYKESKNDGSTNNFVLPGKVWDSFDNEAFVDQSYLQNNYVVVNPNVLVDVSQKSNNTSTMTGVEAESLADQKALNSFTVASKTITKQDYVNATSFSKLTNTYDKYQVYEVSDSINGTLYFLSQEDALNYYFKINNMKLHELTPTKYVYVFDNKEFESKNELYAYVKERIVEIR